MSNDSKIYLCSGVRTPIGSFRGSFASTPASELGIAAATEAIKRAGIDASTIDEVVTGCVLTAGMGQNISRQVALGAGVPNGVPAYTVNKVCSSSLKALQLATLSIRAGNTKSALVVGTENMSRVPFYIPRGELPYGGAQMIDGLAKDGLEDASLHCPMGLCAEKSAKDFSVSRSDSDTYAIESYRKAATAWKEGKFSHEVVPVSIQDKRKTVIVAEDEEYKKLIAEKVPTLSPAFLKDGTGTITAANASSLNDGAVAAVVSASPSASPLAEILAFAESSAEPVDFTVVPVDAVKKLLSQTNLSVGDIALWEVNEAFAVTALAFIKTLGIDPSRVNVKGGAVALGHPLGMSGLRITVSLAHSLEAGQLGVAAICNGGGEAVAVLLKGC